MPLYATRAPRNSYQPSRNAISANTTTQRFEQQLQDALVKAGNATLDSWLQRTDRELKQSVEELVNTGLQDLEKNLLASLNSDSSTQAGGFDGFFNGAGSGLAGFVSKRAGQFVTRSISELFSRESTRVFQRETERSQQTGSALRTSRSQQQADLATQQARGQRNL